MTPEQIAKIKAEALREYADDMDACQRDGSSWGMRERADELDPDE